MSLKGRRDPALPALHRPREHGGEREQTRGAVPYHHHTEGIVGPTGTHSLAKLSTHRQGPVGWRWRAASTSSRMWEETRDAADCECARMAFASFACGGAATLKSPSSQEPVKDASGSWSRSCSVASIFCPTRTEGTGPAACRFERRNMAVERRQSRRRNNGLVVVVTVAVPCPIVDAVPDYGRDGKVSREEDRYVCAGRPKIENGGMKRGRGGGEDSSSVRRGSGWIVAKKTGRKGSPVGICQMEGANPAVPTLGQDDYNRLGWV